MIRVLYFEGCPNWEAALAAARRAAGGHPVETVAVSSRDEAVRLRFLGSPTVQVDGVDVERAARDRTDFGISCRLYVAGDAPSAEMIAAALADQSQTALARGVPFVCAP